ELQRKFVGQLASGACLDFAVNYQKIAKTKGIPRHSH
ncbi:MAG: dihydroxy-acid dehydratase family protein, partial [Reyranella sp.]|nr:dihydroxy-acid dehydratase family protein [Reyranella sp.]